MLNRPSKGARQYAPAAGASTVVPNPPLQPPSAKPLEAGTLDETKANAGWVFAFGPSSAPASDGLLSVVQAA